MTIRILATGDIHIGRRPSQVLDSELAERASAGRIWEKLVTRAIDERVDAVVMSGDIVDHDNRFYEATGPLERGILRIAEQKIPTYAVAGNHDWDVFPRILSYLDTPYFHFLGRNGVWEEALLQKNGQAVLRIMGWSFPSRHVPRNPLVDLRITRETRIPTMGVLHADLDAANSSYAPVQLHELRNHDLAFWLLGHIHRPRLWKSESEPFVLYPGSPQGLSPKEPGQHGPWLVEFEGMRVIDCRQLVIAPVRYDTCEVDLTYAKTQDDLDTNIGEAISSCLELASNENEPPELLLLSLRLSGATTLCDQIESMTRAIDELERSRGGVNARVIKVINQTGPAIELHELVDRNDVSGALARILITLEGPNLDDSCSELIQQTTAILQKISKSSTYIPLTDRDEVPNAEQACLVLKQQCRKLLSALCAQRVLSVEDNA